MGAALLRTEQTQAALETLERVLLLAPNHGGAAIDYAEALYRTGKTEAAVQLNRQLMENSATPSHIRRLLALRNRSWEAAVVRWRRRLQVSLGIDNNLNRASAQDEVSLTFGDSLQRFQLDANARSQSGPFLGTLVHAERLNQGSTQGSRLDLLAQNRLSPISDADTSQLLARYQRRNLLGAVKSLWQIEASTFLLGHSVFFHRMEAGAGLIKSGDRCEYSGRILAANEEFVHGSAFDNHAYALEGETRCRQSGLVASFQARLLYNKARGSRPGGDYGGARLRLDLERPLASSFLRMGLEHEVLLDRKGYSPLLSNGARRKLESTEFRVLWSKNLSADLALRLSLRHEVQHSNLDLFESRSSAAEAGFSLRF